METLHIYDRNGAEIATRNLQSVTGTLYLVASAAGVKIEETPAAGAEVLGALFRDEDGWNLASADPEKRVSCGSKSAADLALVPGAAVSFADARFLLERDTALAGDVLVWKSADGDYAVEPLAAGRNVLAHDSVSGAVTVNPPLAGKELCELFATGDGLEVIVSAGDDKGARLSVGRRTLFTVGDFRGMLLDADEAAKAMRTGNPFAWPSR